MSSSSIVSSQSVVLATAMVVSSTVIFLAFSKQKSQTLRSCLYTTEGEQRKKKKKKTKKRVHFAKDVKERDGNGEEYRRERSKKFSRKVDDRNCRNEIPGMPPNRVALYNGILRDRVHTIDVDSPGRLDCSQLGSMKAES